jgi:hypothetical protein
MLYMQGGNVDLGMQIANHRTIVTQIAIRLGGMPQAQQYLKKCLYYVNIGSKDFINNYYLPQYYPTSRTYNPHTTKNPLISHSLLATVILIVSKCIRLPRF